jgi:hypothetical protein
MHRISALTAIAFLLFTTSVFGIQREVALREAREALADSRLPASLSEALGRKLLIASHFGTQSDAALQGAAQQIDQASAILNGPQALGVSAEVRAALRRRLERLSESLRHAAVTASVPITVRAFVADETGTEAAAGAGVSVRVDGFEVALTDAGGTATVNVGDGEHLFAAASGIDFGGSVLSTVDSSQAAPIDVLMGVGGDYSLAASLQVDEATDGVVASDLSSFTLRFRDPAGAPIPVQQLLGVYVESSTGTTNVTSSFSVATAGTLRANDPASFRTALLNSYGPFLVRARAVDATGHPYRGTANIDLGRYHLSGSLSGPPGVPVSGVPVSITNQRDGFSFWATTSSGGVVVFPQALPEGVYSARCEVVSGGVRYLGRAAFVASAGGNFSMALRTVDGN